MNEQGREKLGKGRTVRHWEKYALLYPGLYRASEKEHVTDLSSQQQQQQRELTYSPR